MDLNCGQAQGRCRVGPQSVGQHLMRDALCFGGGTCTATDVAVALGRMDIPGCHPPSAGVHCLWLSLFNHHTSSFRQKQIIRYLSQEVCCILWRPPADLKVH